MRYFNYSNLIQNSCMIVFQRNTLCVNPFLIIIFWTKILLQFYVFFCKHFELKHFERVIRYLISEAHSHKFVCKHSKKDYQIREWAVLRDENIWIKLLILWINVSCNFKIFIHILFWLNFQHILNSSNFEYIFQCFNIFPEIQKSREFYIFKIGLEKFLVIKVE